jgi:hypothetical protein
MGSVEGPPLTEAVLWKGGAVTRVPFEKPMALPRFAHTLDGSVFAAPLWGASASGELFDPDRRAFTRVPLPSRLTTQIAVAAGNALLRVDMKVVDQRSRTLLYRNRDWVPGPEVRLSPGFMVEAAFVGPEQGGRLTLLVNRSGTRSLLVADERDAFFREVPLRGTVPGTELLGVAADGSRLLVVTSPGNALATHVIDEASGEVTAGPLLPIPCFEGIVCGRGEWVPGGGLVIAANGMVRGLDHALRNATGATALLAELGVLGWAFWAKKLRAKPFVLGLVLGVIPFFVLSLVAVFGHFVSF